MANNPRIPNRLINESSPYLLQHAYNPVKWYAWGEEALTEAKKQNKPILLSIGYAACHWCHVMERESFEDDDVAALMNTYFINIKVDREERPDIDQIYMDAVQAISGAGGWPLNVFLTPAAKPFYGGTYFPPKPMQGRPSWPQVLTGIHRSYIENRTKIEEQADSITNYIQDMDKAYFIPVNLIDNEIDELVSKEDIATMYQSLRQHFDEKSGGFASAPKFPHFFNLSFLFNYFDLSKEQEAIHHALFSLEKMLRGGIYDQIGGGLSRYSVDAEWRVPHFEKMLYDNALFVSTLCEAWKLSKVKIYKEGIEGTLDFVQRELLSPVGGFYSSLDADSEGVEGKYYVWDKKEVETILLQHKSVFCNYFNISENGNWEGKNILERPISDAIFAQTNNLDEIEFSHMLIEAKRQLLAAREQRVKPGLDDKILLNWNALMCSAFAKAYQTLGHEVYKTTAVNNITFLIKQMQVDGILYHNYKNGEVGIPAFLDDYAFFISALIDVYTITFDTSYLGIADNLTQAVVKHYFDGQSNLFFYTSENQKDIILRKKEVFDSVIPSGNSTMAENLFRLGIIYSNTDYTTRAEQMVATVKSSVLKYNLSFGKWASIMLNINKGFKEIAVVGNDYENISKTITSLYLPESIIMADKNKNGEFALLQNKYIEGKTLIYWCENYLCHQPHNNLDDFLLHIGYNY